MIPSVIHIGPLSIHLYGLFLGLGILAGGSISANLAQKESIPKDKFWDIILWGTIGGIIGARLYHVVDLRSYYKDNLLLIPQIWTGGLGIYGAIAGGVIGFKLYLNKRDVQKTSLSLFLDLIAFGSPITQAIGRLGNFVNQELYGLPTNLPWGIYINPVNRLTGYENNTHFHPLFAYEAILNILSFTILLNLLRVRKWPMGKGKYFALFLLNYAIIRALLESLRINPWMIFNIPTAQFISIFVIIASLIYLKKN